VTPLGVAIASIVFVAGALISLGASAVLVTHIERVAARLGLHEAILGLVAAIAADGPEISSATAALVRGQHNIGAGVVLGSNVFNLAALLGVASLIAGRISLHRSVILFGGGMALWTAAISVLAMLGAVTAPVALALVLAAFVPYVVVSGLSARRLGRLRLPRAGVAWISRAVLDEETELRPALHPSSGSWRNATIAGAALAVVIVASVGMEHAASDLGNHFAVPGIVVGGIVLAAVTSLPNAVAAVYLAVGGRGPAVLSTALNSNNLNVLCGLLIPSVILGLAPIHGGGAPIAGWYLALTALCLTAAYLGRGLGRVSGALIVVIYVGFVVVVVAG
jgi:cation:H+ antiporter